MFSLSDIKNIVIPCDQEQCSGEVRLPPSDDFDANRPIPCPVCHKEGFIGTFRAIRAHRPPLQRGVVGTDCMTMVGQVPRTCCGKSK